MKKIIPFLLLAIVALSSCASDAPTETPAPPTDESGLYNPPPAGGILEGAWIDKWGARLTQQGVYDPNIPAMLTGEIRVSGNWIWFDLRGGTQRRLYSGVISGDVITGYEELSAWTATQGIVATYPPKPFNWTRAK